MTSPCSCLAPAGEQTLGVPRERLIGIDLLQLHPAKSREKLALLLRTEDGEAGRDRQVPGALAARDDHDDQHPGSGAAAEGFQDVRQPRRGRRVAWCITT